MKMTSNKDNLRDEDNIKKEDDLNMKMVSILRQPQIANNLIKKTIPGPSLQNLSCDCWEK